MKTYTKYLIFIICPPNLLAVLVFLGSAFFVALLFLLNFTFFSSSYQEHPKITLNCIFINKFPKNLEKSAQKFSNFEKSAQKFFAAPSALRKNPFFHFCPPPGRWNPLGGVTPQIPLMVKCRPLLPLPAFGQEVLDDEFKRKKCFVGNGLPQHTDLLKFSPHESHLSEIDV